MPSSAILAIILIVRVVMAAQRRNEPPAVKDPWRLRVGYLTFTVVILLPLTVSLWIQALDGSYVLGPLALLGLMFCFPWLTARWVFIPLGMPRSAAFFSHLSGLGWRADAPGGSALAAAWALLRARHPTDADRTYVETKATSQTAPLRGAGLVAVGLRAAARGDTASAREVIRSSLLLDPRVYSKRAQRLAQSWLLSDAALRGGWRDIVGLHDDWQNTRHGPGALAAFFRASALRLLRNGHAPGKPMLLLRWLWARKWYATYPLLRRAWQPAFSRKLQKAARPGTADTAPLTYALGLSAALMHTPSDEQPHALARAAWAWETALKAPGVLAWVGVRASELKPRDGNFSLDSFHQQVEQTLATFALEHHLPLEKARPRSALLEAITVRAREELLQRLEAATEALRQRLAEKRALRSEDEWRAFVSIWRQCEDLRALGGEEARRFAFEASHAPVCNLGAWLFNERDERTLANGMFRWLLTEADAVGDDEDRRRYRKNVDCGP